MGLVDANRRGHQGEPKGRCLMKTGLIIAIIAMVTVALWFIIDYLAPGSPSWVVYIFGAAAIIGVAGSTYGKNHK